MEGYFHPDTSHKRTPSDDSTTRARAKPVASEEAVRRGLSFGPLKSRSRQNSTAGVLKDAASTSPGSIRRSLSTEHESKSGEDEKARVPLDEQTRGAEGSGEEDVDAEGAWSSGDESARGRSPKSKHLQESKESNQAEDEETQSEPSAEKKADTPNIERTTSKRFIVHPNTNFDKPAPIAPTREASPTLSEEEELEATQRAQALSIWAGPPDNSVANRTILTLVRGDFIQIQKEAKEGTRRLRTYLAATDLSGEAAYALEWTFGTVMRTGDTLYAVYAVDEVTGTGKTGDSLPIGEGGAAMQHTAKIVESTTSGQQKASLKPFPSPLNKKSLRSSSRKSSAANSTDSRALSIAQQERIHAVKTLQETCLGLLRKTGLECRVVIEVIHCKSPKYMITEAVSEPCTRISTNSS